MKTKQNPTGLPSIGELRKYHEGALSPEQEHALEKMALENELLSEALEGFSGFDHWDEVPSPAAFQQAKGGSWLRTVAWSIGSVMILALGIWMALPTRQGMEESVDGIRTTTDGSAAGSAALEVDGKEEIYPGEPVDSFVVANSPSTGQVTFSGEESSKASTDGASTTTTLFEYIVHIPPKKVNTKVEFTGDPVDNKPLLIKQKSVTGNSPIYHVNDYKLVDYRELRHDNWASMDVDEMGTPANLDHPDDARGQASPLRITYFRYIGNAIEHFAEKSYGLALSQFETVLRQYPDDVNAALYGGLCAFHMGQFTKASKLLNSCLQNEIDTFHEDAEFYLARSLMKENKLQDAHLLLERIADSNGYYAPQARLLLKK